MRDVVGKRMHGWVNLSVLGRQRRFRQANLVVDHLRKDFRNRGFDQLLFSGDATALGFARELAFASERLRVSDEGQPPGIAVPGNHDLYTSADTQRRIFETAFAPWQSGLRVDSEHTYPFARKVGHVWLIAVNSATPNRLFWDASGQVGARQLERLHRLCAQLDPGPRIVVSHYPILTAARKPEARWHRLRDWKRTRDTVAACGVNLWVHGHKHRWYVVESGKELPFHSICVGSATQKGLAGYHEYLIMGWELTCQRRVFDPLRGTFHDGERFVLDLAI